MNATMQDENERAVGAVVPTCGLPEQCALWEQLLSEAERHLVIPINPHAAILRAIREVPGFAPNSAEFSFVYGGRTRAVQRAEHIGSGAVRYYYASNEGGPWVVRYYDRAAIGSIPDPAERALAQAMQQAADQRQVIQFNPQAALQRRMYADGDGYFPNSPEFDLWAADERGVMTLFRAQRSERLDATRVRLYYARVGAWGNVMCVARDEPGRACCPGCGGVTPVAPRVISRGNTAAKRIALTFDAGSGSGLAQAILDTLKQYGVRSTCFLTGSWANENRALVARMVADGHSLANHSYTHPDCTTLSPEEVRREVEVTDGALVALTGRPSRPYFRPPFGAYNQPLVNQLGQLGYNTVMWTIDSGDWRPEWSPQRVRDEVLNRAVNGAIVVHHLGSEQTPLVLGEIIQGLRQRGYELVTLSRVLE